MLTNSGTINGGVSVANQDLIVHGGGGGSVGRFMGSDITVVNGALTFASGATRLDVDVVVSSIGGIAGAGAMTNRGELILVGARTLGGDFSQSAGGIFTTVLSSESTHGSLSATGTATFGGYLNLVQSGLSLADGQTFGLFSFFSSSGGFLGLSVDGTSLSSLGGGEWAYGGLILSEKWTGTTMGLVVFLNAVPEIDAAGMGSVFAVVAGALGLLERRRLKVA